MQRKNRNRFSDDDEVLVADILLQIPHTFSNPNPVFHSIGALEERDRTLTEACLPIRSKKEDRLETADGLTRQLLKSEIENVTGLQNTLTALNSEAKKEDQLKMGDRLTHHRELKSKIENVTGLHNTLTAVKSETKLNLVTAMAKAKEESGEQVHPKSQQPPALPFLRRHSAGISALVPSTSGSIVAYPVGPFVVMPHLDLSSSMETLRPNLNPPLNLSLYFNPIQSKRVAAAQARKKRSQIYRVKKPKAVQVPQSSLLVGC